MYLPREEMMIVKDIMSSTLARISLRDVSVFFFCLFVSGGLPFVLDSDYAMIVLERVK